MDYTLFMVLAAVGYVVATMCGFVRWNSHIIEDMRKKNQAEQEDQKKRWSRCED